jgi:hypothetical protein
MNKFKRFQIKALEFFETCNPNCGICGLPKSHPHENSSFLKKVKLFSFPIHHLGEELKVPANSH